jgi:hypothetical protein
VPDPGRVRGPSPLARHRWPGGTHADRRVTGAHRADGLAGPARRYLFTVALLAGTASMPIIAVMGAGSATVEDAGQPGEIIPFIPPPSEGPVVIPLPPTALPGEGPPTAAGDRITPTLQRTPRTPARRDPLGRPSADIVSERPPAPPGPPVPTGPPSIPAPVPTPTTTPPPTPTPSSPQSTSPAPTATSTDAPDPTSPPATPDPDPSSSASPEPSPSPSPSPSPDPTRTSGPGPSGDPLPSPSPAPTLSPAPSLSPGHPGREPDPDRTSGPAGTPGPDRTPSPGPLCPPSPGPLSTPDPTPTGPTATTSGPTGRRTPVVPRAR